MVVKNINLNQLMQVLTPILVALHEHKILDIALLPHIYEDALARRRAAGVPPRELGLQKWLVVGMSQLAVAVKADEKQLKK